MHKYEIIIYWSQDDDAFIAEVPELPGCAADGKSPVEALQNSRDFCKLGSPEKSRVLEVKRRT